MGLSVYAAFDDSMHSVDLGVNPHLLGNVLWHIAYTDIFGAGPPEARLARAWEYIQTEYSKRRTGTQFSNLELGMFTNTDNPSENSPFLKGKAAENRHLTPILRDLWASISRNTYEDHVTRALTHLCDYYECLDFQLQDGSYPLFLPKHVETNNNVEKST